MYVFGFCLSLLFSEKKLVFLKPVMAFYFEKSTSLKEKVMLTHSFLFSPSIKSLKRLVRVFANFTAEFMFLNIIHKYLLFSSNFFVENILVIQTQHFWSNNIVHNMSI